MGSVKIKTVIETSGRDVSGQLDDAFIDWGVGESKIAPSGEGVVILYDANEAHHVGQIIYEVMANEDIQQLRWASDHEHDVFAQLASGGRYTVRPSGRAFLASKLTVKNDKGEREVIWRRFAADETHGKTLCRQHHEEQ